MPGFGGFGNRGGGLPKSQCRRIRSASGSAFRVSSCYHVGMADTCLMLPDPLISSDPGRLGGVPCFTGTRVPVKSLFDHLEAGDSLDVFLADFPSVTRQHAQAVLKLALTSAIGVQVGPKQAAE